MPLGDGTIEPGYADDPLDCRTRRCRDGEAVDEADGDDDPEDEACREVVCDGDEPAPGDPINEGEACGPNPVVCADGVCVGCDVDDQCPDPTAACLVGDCLGDGTCGEQRTGVDPTDDDGDDCVTPTCDGTSDDATFVVDTADTPPNGVCGLGACSGMTPMQNPATAGTACSSGGAVCVGDVSGATACVICTVDGGTTFGCTGGTPICDEAAGGGEGACEECMDTAAGSGTDLGCPANEVCNLAVGNACGEYCEGDPDCSASPDGKDCRVGGTCGCSAAADCNHAEAAGTNCAGGVCSS